MDILEKAFEVAKKAHQGQSDRSGVPYINHPLTVARNCRSYDAKVVGLLHDVIEDSFLEIDDLDFLTVEQKEALDLVTRYEDEGYFEYIEKIKPNKIAREVKLCDLEHNMDMTRLKVITEADKKRLKKYQKAYNILKSDG